MLLNVILANNLGLAIAELRFNWAITVGPNGRKGELLVMLLDLIGSDFEPVESMKIADENWELVVRYLLKTKKGVVMEPFQEIVLPVFRVDGGQSITRIESTRFAPDAKNAMVGG